MGVNLDLLAKAYGSEERLIERITRERELRGWSQSELSRRISAEGHKFAQTAISQMENPGDHALRRIRIEEALGFAKVFDLPLLEMLIPLDMTTDTDAARRAERIASLDQQLAALTAERDALVQRTEYVAPEPVAEPEPGPDQWLTVKQAAERYGQSPQTIRRRIADGTLTARKFGPRLVRIDPNALDRFGARVGG